MPDLKFIKDKDPWLLAEDIPDIDFSFAQIWLSCFANEFAQPGGKPYRKVLSIHKGYHLWFYFGENDSYQVGEFLVKKFIQQSAFANEVNKEILIMADKLREYCNTIPEDNLQRLSNKMLWKYFEKYFHLHTKYYQWCWIPVAVDMFHSNLTDRLKRYLRSIGVLDDKLNEFLVLLTQPRTKSLIQIEQEDLLKIAIKVQKDKYHRNLFLSLWEKFREQDVAKYGYKTHSSEYEDLFEENVNAIKDKIKYRVYKQIQKHYEKYFYVAHMWVGQVSSFEFYLKELVRLVASGANLENKLKQEQKKQQRTLKDRQKLIKKLNIKGSWLTIFDGFGDFMVTKIYRRFAQIFAVYKMEYLYKELGRRLKLDLMEARFMLPAEIKRALMRNQADRKCLKSRKRFCVYYVEKGYERIFVGEKAKALAKTTETKVTSSIEITGQTGCVGKAVGVVKKIFRPEDMGKMKKGDILVSIATDPDIVPAMKKAAAIVTEQGGVTSHAAIVSREMNIPCVIGTKIATKVLNDGDKVEVDANKGIVRKL